MADETPPDPQPSRRPPVRMGLRVVARHSAGRYGGRHLAHSVVESHRPKLLDASTRLARAAVRRRPRAAGPARGVGSAPAAPRRLRPRRRRRASSARSGRRPR